MVGVMKWKAVVVWVIVILILVSAGVALYLNYSYYPKCTSYECFKDSMVKCSRVSYVNDGAEATWEYKIEGTNKNSCQIMVTLLQAKEGSLGIDRLNGYSMECSYPIGISNYPEKDLTKCSGKLREELQTIIINKLHIYIINNLGALNESIKSLGQ